MLPQPWALTISSRGEQTVGVGHAMGSEVVVGRKTDRRFTREQLLTYQDATVPDLIGDRPPKLVFVGINPGLWTAATQTHFAHPSNRFYPALFQAGITDRELDRVAGLDADDRAHLLQRGIAITNIVARATARASELTADELRHGAQALKERLKLWEPAVVAVAGITAYRVAFGRRKAALGLQEEDVGGAALWVVPNPSGLNAHETISSLAEHYRQVAEVAGVV